MKICRKCTKCKLEGFGKPICPKCENDNFIEIIKERFKEEKKIFPFNEQISFQELSKDLNPEEIELIFKNCTKVLNILNSEKIIDEFLEYKFALENEFVKEDRKNEEIRAFARELNERKDEMVEKMKKELELQNLSTLDDYQYLVKIFENYGEYDNSIRQLVIEKNKEHPEFSHLQCLYYVLYDKNFVLFEREPYLIESKYEGNCIKCKQKILPGRKIFWYPDSKKIKHADCKTDQETRDVVYQLAKDAIKNYEKNDLDRVKYYVDRINELETGSIFKNQEIGNYLSEILSNPTRLNLLTDKISKKLRSLAQTNTTKQYFEKFQNEFISEISIQLGKSENEVNRDFKIVLRQGKNNLWKERIGHYYELATTNTILNDPIKKETRYIGMLEESGDELFITDPYARDGIINELIVKLERANHVIKKLRILAHWKMLDKGDLRNQIETLVESCDRLKKLEGDSFNFNYKIVLSRSDKNWIHDRLFFGEKNTWETSKGLISFSQNKITTDKIERKIDPDYIEELREKYEKTWDDEETVDLSNKNLEIIEKKVNDMMKSKNYQ